MEKVYYIIIKMINIKERNMKVNLKMIKKKVKELYIGFLVIDMKVIGKIIKQKVEENIIVIVVIDMKVNLRVV